VGVKKVGIPLEDMVDVATDRAMARAMPEIRNEVSAAMVEARNMAATVIDDAWGTIQPRIEEEGKRGLAVVGAMIAVGSLATVLFLRSPRR
jgi:uncharacterized protein (UPF0218 family)